MKLSVSNIGWKAENDEHMYAFMKEWGYCGLEIAPTRIFPDSPYDKLEQANTWAKNLKREYGFEISSMQSIWFGRHEKLFGTETERSVLMEYTKRAIDFATITGCGNLVFGCPENRIIPNEADYTIGINFFKKIGDYAVEKETMIAIEANPPIYNTNYINDTLSAFKLIEQVDSKGFLLNLDIGTMIENEESIDILAGKVCYINHIHISEPGLKTIQERNLHRKLRERLLAERYQGYVSVEMGKTDDLNDIKSTMKYVKELFV